MRPWSGIGASVLCPGFVNTNILDSQRNRPQEFVEGRRLDAEGLDSVRGRIAAGLPPSVVAHLVFEGIIAGQLYILTGDDFDPVIRARMERILSRDDPPALSAS